MKVSIRNLGFGYGEKVIFQDFSLEAGPETPLVILGPSGCGKTSLLRLIAALEKPRSGGIFFTGEDAGPEASPREGPWGLSYVFQEDRLLPWLTALENVCLPINRLRGKSAAMERGRYFLELTGLGDRTGSYPAELSGGERRRVAIARGFAYPGSLILMDEPFQSLDIPLRIALMDLCRELLALEDRLLIAVTHDPREAVYLGQRIILLGPAGQGITLDEKTGGGDTPLGDPPGARRYASPEAALIEERLLEALARRAKGPEGA